MRLAYYYFSFVLGLCLAIVCSMKTAGKLGTEKNDAALFTVAGFSAGVIGAVLMSAIYNAVLTSLADGQELSRSLFSLYGGLLFVPVLIAVPFRLAKKDVLSALDVCSAGVYVLLGTAKTGCHVYGCCRGIPFEAGVLSPQTGERVFPVQLTEALLTFVIAFAVYRFTVNKKRPKGSVYPLGLILYGIMRFFIQFLRFHELPAEADLIGFMDLWQTVSAAAVLTGAVWLSVIYLRGRYYKGYPHSDRSRAPLN